MRAVINTNICLLQVDQAYLQYGPDHNIVAFMQSLGYADFTAASPDEEKMTQFKRALKMTRPAFAATRSPMQQVMHPLLKCVLNAHVSPATMLTQMQIFFSTPVLRSVCCKFLQLHCCHMPCSM